MNASVPSTRETMTKSNTPSAISIGYQEKLVTGDVWEHKILKSALLRVRVFINEQGNTTKSVDSYSEGSGRTVYIGT